MTKKLLALLLAALMMLLAACSGGNAPAQEGETGSAPAQTGTGETAQPSAGGNGAAQPSTGRDDAAQAETEPAPANASASGEGSTVTATSADLQPLTEEPAAREEERPVVSSSSDLLELGASEGSDLDEAQKRGTLRAGVAEGSLTDGVWACFEGAITASFAASIALGVEPTEGGETALIQKLQAGELDCLWLSPASAGTLDRSVSLLLEGEELCLCFRADSELRPLFDKFLSAASEQGAMDMIAGYYDVTASLG